MWEGHSGPPGSLGKKREKNQKSHLHLGQALFTVSHPGLVSIRHGRTSRHRHVVKFSSQLPGNRRHGQGATRGSYWAGQEAEGGGGTQLSESLYCGFCRKEQVRQGKQVQS